MTLGAGLHTAASLFKESRFTLDTVHTVSTNTGLTAGVTALTHTFRLIISIETRRTLLYTRGVQQEVWCIAAVAVVFAWS